MPLLSIPNQPLGFQTVRPTDCFSCDERTYYMPVLPGDPVQAQFIQTPCGVNLACDGDFTGIDGIVDIMPDGDFNDLEAEILLNGTFTGNANNWSLSPPWSYGSNAVSKVGGATTDEVRQFVSVPVIAGAMYRLQVEVTAHNGEVLFIGVANAGTGNSIVFPNITTTGTYTYYVKQPTWQITQVFIDANTAFAGTIDNVSFRRIAPTWNFGGAYGAAAGYWSMNSNGFPQTMDTNDAYGVTNAQLRCDDIITPATQYTVTVDFEDGDGTVSFNVGGQISNFYTLNGGAQTVTFNITSLTGDDFIIIPGANSEMIISNVEIETGEDDCWEYTGDFTYTGGNSLCHTPGSIGHVENATTFAAGYYRLKYTVSNRTEGSISAILSGVTAQAVGETTNETFVKYILTTASGILEFFTSADFDGCISDVEVHLLKQDYVFEIRDIDGNFIYNISSFARYDDEFVTINFDFAGIPDPLSSIPYGCYYIYAYDSCEVQYEEIITDGEFNNPLQVYWKTDSAVGTFSVTGGQLRLTINTHAGIATGTTINNHKNPYDGTATYEDNVAQIPAGSHNYRISFDVTRNDVPASIIANLLGGYQRPTPSPFNSTPVGTYTVDIAYDPLYNTNPQYGTPGRFWFGFHILWTAPVANGSIIEIDNVSVRRIEPFDITYISQPIRYQATAECTKIIQAYSNAKNSGFKFFTGVNNVSPIFKLSQRIYIRAINPSYPEDTDDYLYSEGTRSRNFGQSSKNFTVLTDHVAEHVHDCLRIQRILQYFEIGEPDDFKRWFPLPGDYVPEWNKAGESKLAPARFEVQERDEATKFYRNT